MLLSVLCCVPEIQISLARLCFLGGPLVPGWRLATEGFITRVFELQY